MSLSAEQGFWLERALSGLDRDRLVQTLVELVDIAAPTGDEGPLARAIVLRLCAQGLDSEEQALDAQQSNAVARLRGRGEGLSLMLYAPLDTVTSDSEKEDLPWAGPELVEEMRAKAVIQGGHVLGLGAHNPKGHAACAIAAFEAIAAAAAPLRGELMLGMGAGGMPTNARPGARLDSGHGVGCAWMLEHGFRPDCAVIAKPGWAVSWEEVGLAWYEVETPGAHTYVGSRHLMPYANAIGRAAQVVEALEAWFPQWAEMHRSGLVAPQGVVSFIEAGWERMPAFTPATCRFRFDLRLSPRTSPREADAVVAEKLRALSEVLGFPIRWKRLVAIPGASTPEDSPVVQRAIEAWEWVEGRKHTAMTGTSGATDANILRAYGVPTARIGMPKVGLPQTDFQRGMNAVRIEDMVKLTKHLIYTAIAVCGV